MFNYKNLELAIISHIWPKIDFWFGDQNSWFSESLEGDGMLNFQIWKRPWAISRDQVETVPPDSKILDAALSPVLHVPSWSTCTVSVHMTAHTTLTWLGAPFLSVVRLSLSWWHLTKNLFPNLSMGIGTLIFSSQSPDGFYKESGM